MYIAVIYQSVNMYIAIIYRSDQLPTMTLEDPINWSHPPPSWAVPPDLQVLHCVNAAYKSQDLLQQPGLQHASTGMPDQRFACDGPSGYKSPGHLAVQSAMYLAPAVSRRCSLPGTWQCPGCAVSRVPIRTLR